MIVYQETIGKFIDHCRDVDANGECKQIADIIQREMINAGLGAANESQMRAWRRSLPIVAKALKGTSMDRNIDVAIEYKINQQKNRIDFLVYGTDENGQRNVIIIELKQWSRVQKSALSRHVLANVGEGRMEDHWHPSYQAQNYANCIEGFNINVKKESINLHACSYLHNMPNGYRTFMESEEAFPLVKRSSPCFLEADANKLVAFLEKYVKKPQNDILYEIDLSELAPTKQLAGMLKSALRGNEFFSYDDNQSYAVATIVAKTKEAIELNKKTVIIIKGGAGTGKSIVALNALGQLVHPKEGPSINAAYFTTNGAPRYLYLEELIKGIERHRRKKQKTKEELEAQALGAFLKNTTVLKGGGENDFKCGIFDEAHRIFDFKGGTGVRKDDHIFEQTVRKCLVSVFFIDEDQAVTCDDYATIERIREVAHKYHADIIEDPRLELTSQFRCMGGEDYTSFIKSFLGYNADHPRYKLDARYDFRVFDDASEMMELIRQKDEEEKAAIAERKGLLFDDNTESGRCRVVAGYTFKWISKKEDRDGPSYDIVLDNGKFRAKWNLFRAIDYSWLNDPESVNEVGCVHSSQGLDMNYCGVIIGDDLVYRDGHICIDTETHPSKDRAFFSTTPRDVVRKIIRNTYNVLLTRGMKGTYVYCKDKALGEYLKSLII